MERMARPAEPQPRDWPACLAALTLLGGVVGPVALVLGHGFPELPVTLGLLAIGALGYGISIWLDRLALRNLGAARSQATSGAQPRWRCRTSVQPLHRWVRCRPSAIRARCRWQVSSGMPLGPG